MINPSLQRELFTPETNIFVILDGASVSGLLGKLHTEEPEYVCLYQGELLPDMAEVAPYLVHLERRSRFAEWILSQGWGNHWGIFALTENKVDMKQARKHFRTFLKVETADGLRLSFRYYDPSVLRDYLPICNEAQTQAIFGPVIAYFAESTDANLALRFTVKNGLPYSETVRLD